MGMGSYNYKNYDFTMPNFNSFNQGLSLQGPYGNFGSIWGSSPWNNYDFSSGLSLQGPYQNFGSIWGNPFYDNFGTFSHMPRMMSFDEFCAACENNAPKKEKTPASNKKADTQKEVASKDVKQTQETQENQNTGTKETKSSDTKPSKTSQTETKMPAQQYEEVMKSLPGGGFVFERRVKSE